MKSLRFAVDIVPFVPTLMLYDCFLCKRSVKLIETSLLGRKRNVPSTSTSTAPPKYGQSSASFEADAPPSKRKKDNKVRPGHGRHRPETKAKIDRPSKSGSDLWEMVEYSDPFSVHYGTTSPIEGHPEFSSSSMASPNSFSAVSTVSLSTEGPDQLDDCRGSDYEVHSNSGNDDDSDSWEDVTEDSGARRFQFVDPVAEMLDSVVQSGVLPREHIFYKLVSSALKYGSYDHSKGEKYQWDPTVVGRDRSSSW